MRRIQQRKPRIAGSLGPRGARGPPLRLSVPAAALVLEAAQLVRDVAPRRCACLAHERRDPRRWVQLRRMTPSRFEAGADEAAPGAQDSSVRRGEADDDELPDAQESAVAEDARRVRPQHTQRALIQATRPRIALQV